MMTQMAPHGYKKGDKPLTRGLWWAVFLAATFILSLCFQTFKTFTLTPTLENGLVWAGMLGLLGVTLAVLMYDSYANERNQGKIQHPLALFEWIYRKQYPSGDVHADNQGEFRP